MNTKKYFLIAAIGFVINVLSAQALSLFVDVNRFLDGDSNTIILVDYQIPYRNLVFLAQSGGYFAEVSVKIDLMEADSVLISQEVTDNIGISSKADAENQQKYYLNRISFKLDKPSYTMRFNATDPNSGRTVLKYFEIKALPSGSLLSDIELNSEVRTDSLQYLPKFKRNNVLYKPQPSLLLNKNTNDNGYVYFETYNNVLSDNGSYMLNLALECDSIVVMDEYLDYKPQKKTESYSLAIPLAELKPGLHKGYITLLAGEVKEERSFDFVLLEEKEEQHYLLPNNDDEYELMHIFMGNRLTQDWKNMNPDRQRRYITQFWRNMAANTKRSIPAIMSLVQDRIDYANRNFGHLKAGWTSDMGRIYIRNGEAGDIERGTSTTQSRFVPKDFQIWKYSSGTKPVYVFIDNQMNGNYKLIYVDGDDLESSNPDWQRFLGTDFDESKLNN
ncbi:MAG: GWxTD domain-containing protein [Candidatus Cloacimonetes bacterium]|nr:GWxTD domain-containing protein [Candidatus Cloacimonadota bacterium]